MGKNQQPCLIWDIGSVENPGALFDHNGNLKERARLIISMSMAIGLGAITKTNWKSFWCRYKIYTGLFELEDGLGEEPRYLTRRHVVRMIGLRTNVKALTDKAFIKGLADAL